MFLLFATRRKIDETIFATKIKFSLRAVKSETQPSSHLSFAKKIKQNKPQTYQQKQPILSLHSRLSTRNHKIAVNKSWGKLVLK
jgi:hypothetical protein